MRHAGVPVREVREEKIIMRTCVVKLEGKTVREKLEALADHYGVDRAKLWEMGLVEFAERLSDAQRRAGEA